MFKSISPKVDFPKLEEDILDYWKKNKIFEKSVEARPADKKWNFLDGPPFITGLPHYGTLLASIPKDIFPRFWTMRGYRVRRVWGWDVHGLPAENKVENKLGLKTKREIEEKIGIAKFIEECKLYVSESSVEWEWYVDHIARWVDFKHAYKTMDLSYMETVMWVFKQMYDKGYIYKGLRVSLYCPHCVTPISNFEVAMDQDNYKEVTEAANTYKYQLKEEPDTFLLAWSTTPWNKIVTPALAVNPKLDYVKVAGKADKEKYILAKSTVKMLKGDYTILKEFKGQALIGKSFIPHYDFYPIEKDKKAFIVIGGDFVSADEGTGIVTIAAYGEEDMKAMKAYNIQIYLQLDEEGTVKKEVPKFGGMYYLKANRAVNEDLAERGLLYDETSITHKVPTCWRCHTRLYYAPIDAWFVDIQKLKPQLKKNNEPVNWFPKHFKYGRFLKSLEAAPDWNISRNRYWGSPVPVWECTCGERIVPGSIAELEKLSGQKITDLHKPGIDEVTIPCPKCCEKVHRVPEVLDSWIEAGSASYAERHYPFDKQVKLEDFFPPDFIVEYTGQIRAWFYVLHVIATAIFDTNAFKNVVVTGVILGTDGRKMSKNFGNYPDPKELLQKYGGDALRLYLMDSPVMHGEDIIISEEQYRHQVRGYLLVLWNIYNFFVTYANVDGWTSKGKASKLQSSNVLDRWILSLLQSLIADVTGSLEKYDTMATIDHLKNFVEDFSTWYIRRSRDRVGPSAEDQEDKEAFYQTAYKVLTTLMKVSAPITPFISEEIYRGLTGEESVHLTDWPAQNQESGLRNQELLAQMEFVRKIVEVGHAKRKELGLKVKQPLKKFKILNSSTQRDPEAGQFQIDKEMQQLIQDELNVKEVEIIKAEGEMTVEFDITQTPELKAEGEARDIIRKIQEERKKLETSMTEKVAVTLPDWPKELEEYIKRRALVENLTPGDFLVSKLS